ncbi:hypothetical protein [Pseudonocardia sp. TRM90224]|uniref:hypothetical protein n=1 Tax=Pseudonocardia sp. TRM90224 TaxID=2812678 RepID=UPI001E32AFB2|nr:hypothetical protein [Pseudonocardia sp. TRM90224]
MGIASDTRDRQLCPHDVDGQLSWCGRCLQTVTLDLLSLPALYRDCEARLSVQADNEAMLTCTRIIGVLSSWCALVFCERGEISPGELVVENMAVFLDMNLGWLAAHGRAEEFGIAIQEIAGRSCTRPAAEGLVPAERTFLRVDHV